MFRQIYGRGFKSLKNYGTGAGIVSPRVDKLRNIDLGHVTLEESLK